MSESMRECPREREALTAVLSGRWRDDLRAHVAACPECGEVTAVSTWLRGVARDTEVGPLPRADRIWWRAEVARRLEERRELADRAARPIRWFGRCAGVAAAAAVATAAWSLGPAPAVEALTRLSDPAALATLGAALLGVGALAARGAVGEA